MPLALPEVDDVQLERSPLAIVVCQLRYEQNLAVSDGDVALAIHDAPGGRDGPYPRIEPQQMFSAQVEFRTGTGMTPLASAATVPVRGWRMRSETGDWVASVMPDHVALETNAYRRWSGGFRERLIALLSAFPGHARPRIEERLGLRYVNRLSEEDAATPDDWVNLVSRDLLGPVGHSFWGPGVENFQEQIQLDLGGDLRCLFRQGLIPNEDGGGFDGYLLDYDVFRQSPRRLDLEEVEPTLDSMNRAALALFQASLTPAYLADLRGESE